MKGWENLASAIVGRAVKDYQNALVVLRDSDDIAERRKARKFAKDCQKYFVSPWHSELSSIDGEGIMRHVEGIVKCGSEADCD